MDSGGNAMDLSNLPDKVDQANALVTISAVFTGISTFFVIIRAIIRTGMIRKTGIDDVLIFTSTLFTIGYLASIVLARDAGLGRSILTLTLGQMETLLKLTYAIEILYYVIIVTTKSSIVAMYYNIALTMSFRRACQITHAFLGVFFIVCIAVTFGQCRPLSLQWDPTLTPVARRASCIDTTAFFYFTSAFNILMDFWILGLPVKALQSLQIRRRNRYVLYGVFGAFAFATAMSCVRLYSIYTYTLAEDPFMEGSLINVWSMIEINVGIICASIPALKPLFNPKVLLASARGENPDAAVPPPPAGANSGNSSNISGGRYENMKKGMVQYHSGEGTNSDVDLATMLGGGGATADKKQPWTSETTTTARLGTATSQKHLVEDERESSSRSIGSSRDDYDNNNFELQPQTAAERTQGK